MGQGEHLQTAGNPVALVHDQVIPVARGDLCSCPHVTPGSQEETLDSGQAAGLCPSAFVIHETPHHEISKAMCLWRNMVSDHLPCDRLGLPAFRRRGKHVSWCQSACSTFHMRNSLYIRIFFLQFVFCMININ